MRRVVLSFLLLALALSPLEAQNAAKPAAAPAAPDLKLPNKDGSLKFAILGDTGTGDSEQIAVGKQIANFRNRFEFNFAVLLGDNLYGRESPGDYRRKFEVPYKPLLDAGVKFYAALGNHDDPGQRNYKLFNMNGERYYAFKPALTAPVRFFVLDSNYMDPQQLEWLEKELAGSGSDWKIAMFHHPMYASGMHGSDEILRAHLEPLFVKHAVNVVLTGHEHFYERIKPQKGIQHFVVGATAKLRKGDINRRSALTAFGYDTGYSFMLAEIDGDEFHFAAINERGQTVDSGVIHKSATTNRVIGTTGSDVPAAKPAGAQAKPAPAPVKPAAPSRTEENPAPAPQPRKSGILDRIFDW